MLATLAMDWERMFVPSKPILEILLRGSLTYLSLFVLMRLFRRQSGSLSAADLLVLLLIADASQNAMGDEYHSITEGLILVATIMGWEYAIDLASYHSPAFASLVERSPLPIVENGTPNDKNLKSELLTMDELMSQLRQHGVDDLSQVRQSFIEGDGHISVITQSPSVKPKPRQSDPTSAG